MHTRIFAFACLLPLAGCQLNSSVTTITNATIDGLGVNSTRSWIAEGSGDFDCVKSVSGQCHFVLYTQHCGAGADTIADTSTGTGETGRPDARHCKAHVFTAFTLGAGTSRHLKNLPPGLHQCVRHDRAPETAECFGSKA